MVGFSQDTTSRRNTILLLEDDPDLSEMLISILVDAGYAVDAVSDGRKGLAYLDQSIPDLIISDVMMPEMDGLEFLRRLRGDSTLRFVPAILLTTKAAIADVVTGFNLGADDYLTKPVDPRELLARVQSKIQRPPIPVDAMPQDRQTGLLNEPGFLQALEGELDRATRGGYSCTLVQIRIYEHARVRKLFGQGAEAALALSIGRIIQTWAGPLELLGRSSDGSFLILTPETGAGSMTNRLEILTRSIVRTSFPVLDEILRVTPLCGYADSPPGGTSDMLRDRARIALEHAIYHLDLRPMRFQPSMAAAMEAPGGLFSRLRSRAEPLRLPIQILTTYVFGWGVPFVIFLVFGTAGFDISDAVYLFTVLVLLLTVFLIWAEGLLALRSEDPPEVPEESYGPVSAIIAAYLPNEAPTLESTIRAFLKMDYPGPMQVILAYNTPNDMPIEERLREIARENPLFIPLRVAGSTSKAQNVNTAISIVSSPVVAIYDADHQPDPGSFRRAWRWIASGSDVVQGHCLIRNGNASWVARMVAIEFEMIYCVNHPGRARLHGFGIFGGSNGFWRTDLLREIRMRGSMLTEDIDAALRAVEAGYTITSDPYIISRELSPTTLKGLFNQRLRWAQGWYQVTTVRLVSSMKAPKLSLRQKLGMFHLLAWREAFPWISMLIVPIIAYRMWRAGSIYAVDWFVPLLVWISLFIFLTGPGQLLFTWIKADSHIKRHPRWFWNYLLMSIFFYAGCKNILARVAHIKEFMGEKAWKVTKRN